MFNFFKKKYKKYEFVVTDANNNKYFFSFDKRPKEEEILNALDKAKDEERKALTDNMRF